MHLKHATCFPWFLNEASMLEQPSHFHLFSSLRCRIWICIFHYKIWAKTFRG